MQVSNSQLNLYKDNRADFIFKYNAYKDTFIVIETTGLPNGAVLNLVDENNNQLYSPVDTNGNTVTTSCYITVGQTNLIPLPAQFTNNLSSCIPFPAGIYNWKLKFNGDNDYNSKELPLTIEIRDFDTWIVSSQNYPDSDITVTVRTYVDTIPTTVDLDLLTANATYNNSTGVITYPHTDIDATVGKHTQILNQAKNYLLTYEIKNPINFLNPTSSNGKTTYAPSIDYHQVGAGVNTGCNLLINNIGDVTVTINGNSNLISGGTIYQKKTVVRNIAKLPPGIYYCVCRALLSDGNTYTCEGSFEVTIANCTLTLTKDGNQLKTTYLYNSTPIPNATIGLIDANDSLIETKTTDSNGQITWSTATLGEYHAVAINYDNEYILSSDTYLYSGILISNLLSGVTLINDISIDNGEIEYNSFTVDNNTTMSDLNNVLTGITYSNGNLSVTSYTTNETRNYFLNETESQVINDFITDITYEDGEITYTQFGDINE